MRSCALAIGIYYEYTGHYPDCLDDMLRCGVLEAADSKSKYIISPINKATKARSIFRRNTDDAFEFSIVHISWPSDGTIIAIKAPAYWWRLRTLQEYLNAQLADMPSSIGEWIMSED
jgi:hypothetical protein